MITLRLTLAPESKKGLFDQDATLKELFSYACKSFGVDGCKLQFGFPPQTLSPSMNGKNNDTTTLRAAGIQNQDRVKVIPVDDNAKKENASANSNCIPGLTSHHYIKSSNQSCPTPKLVSPLKLVGSSFSVQWTASGSKGESYTLSAKGDCTRNDIEVKCDCPSFGRRGEDRTNGRVRVCKHLEAALNSRIDPTAKPPVFNNNKETVDLLSDSDSSSEDGRYNKKRPAKRRQPASAAAANATAASKKIRTMGNRTPCTEAPIKLFATEMDENLRRTHSQNRSHYCYTQIQSLQEIIFGNSTDEPQWLVLSNFLVEFNWLLDTLPQLLTIPRLVFFHTDKQPNPSTWPGVPASAEFFQLNPGADPQTRANPMKYRFEYGSHHTKCFLVGYQNKIRVVVSTGNLRRGDPVKANAAYVEEFALKTGESLGTTSEFEETLIRYIQSYNYTKKRSWLGGSHRETLTKTLARYDYSTTKVILLPSIPGYHNIDSKTPRMGQLKLRECLQKYTTQTTKPRPVVCQFSSIGSTSEAYLHSLQTSMDTCLARSQTKGNSLRLKLVYPTVAEIRTSVEGYLGGDSVPGRSKNVKKPFLQPMWYKWSSDNEGNNPLAKPSNVPHIKSYYQTNASNDGFDWLVITSHNISQPAWGTIRSNKNYGGQHLYIRSWELGVFLSPQTLGVKKLVPFTASAAAAAAQAPDTATVAIPFQTHALERYSPSDEPWACDLVYQRPDRFGIHSCAGHRSPDAGSDVIDY